MKPKGAGIRCIIKAVSICFLSWFIQSCSSTTSADFEAYVQERTNTELSDGLYLIINFNSCLTCLEDLIGLLTRHNSSDINGVTLILMGDKPTLRYYTEKAFTNYRIIQDTEYDVAEIFPFSRESPYLVEIINGNIVYNNPVNERAHSDKILMGYFLD